MKRITILIVIVFIIGFTRSQAQNTWMQKTNFGGTGRYGAVAFSIGNKGYIGTGYDTGYKNDFWEYDPALNSWTQKANFGGTARTGAVGFSIINKGYIGTGGTGYPNTKDFWEYDPDINIWTQKADFAGAGKGYAVGFSIGGKGYLGTGYSFSKDFWEYDPETDTWVQKADFGGTARWEAVGFSIGSKGYIGTGITINDDYKKDFWEYDPTTNSWTQKADFQGTARKGALGFSIGEKGFIGTGVSFNGNVVYYKDFWEYDPFTNIWTQKADFDGTERQHAVGFSIGDRGYIGTGNSFNGSQVYYKDFWEYTPEIIIPVCAIPTTLSTVNITSNTAKLKWLGINGALSYKVRYKITGTSEWTITKCLDNNKTLHALAPSTEYVWQVKSFCDIKPVVTSDWSEKQFFTTDDLRFSEQANYEAVFDVYPNPVSQSATVSFSLNEASSIVIQIMDVNGRSLKVITNKDFSAGSHEVTFNRESLVADIYFLQLKTDEDVMMQKVVVQ